MATYKHGDEVNITGGTYKGRSAMFLGKYGKVMCSVKIEGDTRPHRNIWLTSISPISGRRHPHQGSSKFKPEDYDFNYGWHQETEDERAATKMKEALNIQRQEMEELLKEVIAAKDTITKLEKKIQALLNDKR
jgi:hypothetical protein